MKYFNGLTTVNIELTSRCNKNCWMCGRRKVERENPNMAIECGEMDFTLVEEIARQLPDDIVIQFHNNGEPLLYSRLADAMDLFPSRIRCFDTNAKLLMKRADDVIGRLDTITISTFERDPEWEEQYEIVKQFLAYKGTKTPNVVIRCLGEIRDERRKKYEDLGCIIANRILHSPLGSHTYQRQTTVPEVGFCLELLGHMAINFRGDVSICVRFDPKRDGVLGNIKEMPLLDIWNSDKRRHYIRQHVLGKRDSLPLCRECHFWGIPRGL